MIEPLMQRGRSLLLPSSKSTAGSATADGLVTYYSGNWDAMTCMNEINKYRIRSFARWIICRVLRPTPRQVDCDLP